MDELPRVFNPPTGWLGTANEMNLPPEPRFTGLKLGFEWADPARGQRLKQIFSGERVFTVQDLIAAQTDVTNVTAQRATALLRSLTMRADTHAGRALETLRAWDHRSTRESVGAAIFNVWFHRYVREEVTSHFFPGHGKEVPANASTA